MMPKPLATIEAELRRDRVLAESALALMNNQSIPPTPENFTVWYAYAAGSAPALKHALDILISNKQEFSPAVCSELFDRFFAHQQQTEGLRDIGLKIEQAAAKALSAVQAISAETRSFGETLDTKVEALDDASGLGRMSEIVHSILADSRAMMERSDTVERELSRSTLEIRSLREQVEEVRREAMTDPLTDIGNRKLFDMRMRECVTDSMETGGDLCLIMVDIDHFKRFNDTWGHQMGDVVLRLVASQLVEGIKGRDLAARYGGEEFAIILPDTSLDNAEKLADTLRRTIGGRQLLKRDTKQSLGNITLSLGIALYQPGEPITALIDRADAALYRAKEAGRNRVMTELDASVPPPAPPSLSLPAH
ncbi:MAG TPA: GGDEF domain-containing protein [Stellaceae bacterium]|nr:GGDEF domain-containing protein [Stellaceae bacterium]